MEKSQYWNQVGDNREFPTANPDQLAEGKVGVGMDDKGMLESALNKLTKQEKWLVINYFGIFGNPHSTYQELGTRMKVSRQAAALRVSKTVRKLRKYIRRMEI